jgi:hypothetical protein
MVFFAYPPDFFLRTLGYILGRERRVLRGVPLCCKSGVDRLKAVVLVYSIPCAIRTSGPPVPAVDFGFPFVAFGAYPPCFFLSPSRYIRGR